MEFVVSVPVARYLVRQPVGSDHDVDVVPGLRHEMVQSFDLVVSEAAATQLFTLVVAATPALSEHDRAVISQALRATRRPEVVFLVEATPDSWSAECAASADSPAAVAALGVLCASAGWDKGEPVEVSLNGHRSELSAEFDGRNWRCRVG